MVEWSNDSTAIIVRFDILSFRLRLEQRRRSLPLNVLFADAHKALAPVDDVAIYQISA